MLGLPPAEGLKALCESGTRTDKLPLQDRGSVDGAFVCARSRARLIGLPTLSDMKPPLSATTHRRSAPGPRILEAKLCMEAS